MSGEQLTADYLVKNDWWMIGHLDRNEQVRCQMSGFQFDHRADPEGKGIALLP